MISIRNYLQADRRTEQMLFQLTRLLVCGLEQHSVEGAPEEASRLQESSRQFLAALDSRKAPEELLSRAGCVLDALRQHNQAATDYLQRPVAELQAKVKMLTETITTISSGRWDGIQRLRQIRHEMTSLASVREVHSFRRQLGECLESVLAETERQRAETDRIGERLNHPDQQAQVTGMADPLRDAATGLPIRPVAEEAIAQACQEHAHAYVVVMVINNMQTINGSFGRAFGDLLMHRFADFVREQLPAVDQLFRWNGPTVVALVKRRSALEVRVAIEGILTQPLSVKAPGCDVQVPIFARWAAVPLMASPRVLFRRMDSFADFDQISEELTTVSRDGDNALAASVSGNRRLLHAAPARIPPVSPSEEPAVRFH